MGMVVPLASVWSEVADRAARARALAIGTDFDGTLVPLQDDPEAVALPAASRVVLERLAAAPGVTLAVASGRTLADLESRLGVERAICIGNHGLELHVPGRPYRLACGSADLEAVRGAARAVAAAVRGVPGARVEDKGLTATLHYRQTPAADVAGLLAAARDAARAYAPAAQVMEGRFVLEIRPPVASGSKGRAFRQALADAGVPGDAEFWAFGDDASDEELFAALPPDGVSVHVGARSGPSVARYDVGSPAAAVAALAGLAAARGNVDADIF